MNKPYPLSRGSNKIDIADSFNKQALELLNKRVS